MNWLKVFNSIFILTVIISCHQSEKKIDNTSNLIKQIEKDTGLSISDFTSVKENSYAIMGDYSYSFEMVFDAITFEKLVKQVLLTQQTKNSNWISYESGYRFDIHFSETNKTSSYFLNVNKRILFYLHVEE